MPSFYDIIEKDFKGNDVSLSSFRGTSLLKVVSLKIFLMGKVQYYLIIILRLIHSPLYTVGKVLYGVNVASRYGYTASGYALLTKISKMEGVEVLIFPCNQFGAQEPGSNEEIQSFCLARGVDGGHVFAKDDVNGPNTRPVYRYLREIGVIPPKVSWNFAGKFIIDKNGNGNFFSPNSL